MAAPTLAERYSLRRVDTDYYSDFYTNLNAHPDSKQLVLNTNEDAVVRSIKNLLSTDKYERPFQPRLGSKIRSFLFEDIHPITLKSLEDEIRHTINTHEPRAKITDVIVTSVPDLNSVAVTISFFITSVENTATFKFLLNRIR